MVSPHSEVAQAMKDQWLEGCGTCPGETRSINLTLHYVKEDPDCEQARFHGTMTEPNFRGEADFVVQRVTVARQMGWCACGNTERIDVMMLAYLTHNEIYWDWVHAQPDKIDFTQAPKTELSDDVNMLMAYIADGLDWTEHGSSIYGAWLTDDGKEALANLRRPEYA